MILEQINLPQTHSSVRDGFNSSLALVFIFRLLISLYHFVEGKHMQNTLENYSPRFEPPIGHP